MCVCKSKRISSKLVRFGPIFLIYKLTLLEEHLNKDELHFLLQLENSDFTKLRQQVLLLRKSLEETFINFEKDVMCNFPQTFFF